ncbi:hypothetical protein TNCV_3561551 [Trichonephila clavipes]|nr:hypothetical protein TNCV_3561551 [Trichonephila clavipes]
MILGKVLSSYVATCVLKMEKEFYCFSELNHCTDEILNFETALPLQSTLCLRVKGILSPLYTRVVKYEADRRKVASTENGLKGPFKRVN